MQFAYAHVLGEERATCALSDPFASSVDRLPRDAKDVREVTRPEAAAQVEQEAVVRAKEFETHFVTVTRYTVGVRAD
jgi:hypothetical protein